MSTTDKSGGTKKEKKIFSILDEVLLDEIRIKIRSLPIFWDTDEIFWGSYLPDYYGEPAYVVAFGNPSKKTCNVILDDRTLRGLNEKLSILRRGIIIGQLTMANPPLSIKAIDVLTEITGPHGLKEIHTEDMEVIWK